MSGYSSYARENPAQIRDSNGFDSVPTEKCLPLVGAETGSKMECPIKFVLGGANKCASDGRSFVLKSFVIKFLTKEFLKILHAFI